MNKAILTETMIADSTGVAKCNFYDETGYKVKPGDIIVAMGAYTSLHKGKMVIYTGSRGVVKRLRNFYMLASVSGPNFSDRNWKMVTDQQTGRDSYVLETPNNNNC